MAKVFGKIKSTIKTDWKSQTYISLSTPPCRFWSVKDKVIGQAIATGALIISLKFAMTLPVQKLRENDHSDKKTSAVRDLIL